MIACMCCGDTQGPWIDYGDGELFGYICEDCEKRLKIGGFIDDTTNLRDKRHVSRISRPDNRRE